MSREIEKSNVGIQKTSTGRRIVSTGMMAGLQASLGQVELPKMFNQLVLFVLDGSGSMNGLGISGKTKGYEVHSSVITVLERLKESKNKNSFDISFFAFAEDSVEMFPIKSLAHYNLSKDCFNPCEYLKNRGRTSLCSSLAQTKEIALDYLDKNKYSNSKVIIIILGDGAIEDFENCFKIKQELDKHEKINYSTVLLETPEWQEKYEDALEQIQEEFKSLASDGAFYLSTVDPDEVRKHMIKSITKVSQL
jgi:hypothetical protein